jgi:hypothetical protein
MNCIILILINYFHDIETANRYRPKLNSTDIFKRLLIPVFVINH